MDLGVLPNNKHILDWDESDVHQWFRSLGYPQYEAQVKGSTTQLYVNSFSFLSPTAHKIRGDSLCIVDLEGLKSLGIVTIGQRLSILKAIYHVKLAQNMTFDDDDYIPPCSCNI
jgi:protein STE50